MERTLVLIKPEAVKANLQNEIIKRFKNAGLKKVVEQQLRLGDGLLKEHYAHHVKKPFFPGLIAYMKSGPVIAIVFEGENAVEKVRKVCGATDPLKAEPGTITKDLGTNVQENVVHASDSPENALKEIARFFPQIKTALIK
ncbi:MAG: nucleoside-diphosphate kinase [Candidatus Micrarchaeota archaeon]